MNTATLEPVIDVTPQPANDSAANPAADSAQPNTLPRCSHRTASGRQCRNEARDTHSGLCPRHCVRAASRFAHPSVAATLVGQLTEFKSAEAVNDFLSRLLLLLAEDRLSPRRAAVMAYTCNLLLHSLRAMDLEARVNGDEPEQKIIFDLVRPKREDFEPTPPASVPGAGQPS